ncbi:MAG: ATP-binding cassette domain-containing protein [Fimbriimonadaceae bacterium]|jgi:ABC-2 type transport system ATP-binding protein|nr:ATP-binding cassette domain-containing protein [Fimbriimonadaceae bacterium]
MESSSIVSVESLSKEFRLAVKEPGAQGIIKGLFRPRHKTVQAVTDITFSIQPGEIVGFLGPNGAGKTTTIKMLSGILFPTSGKATVLGYTPFDRKPEMLRQIALVMGNRQQLWWDLPAWDSFVVLREVYDVDKKKFKRRVDHLVESLGLTDKVQTQVRKLSLGERMKCELVAALIHSPRVLFLDEPTIGLDLVSQKRIREFLREFNREEECTILLTSHYMQDVEELCERVIIINHGALVYDGTLQALTLAFSQHKSVQITLTEPVPSDTLAQYGTVLSLDGNVAILEMAREELAVRTGLLLANLPVVDISVPDTDVEDVITKVFTSSLPGPKID